MANVPEEKMVCQDTLNSSLGPEESLQCFLRELEVVQPRKRFLGHWNVQDK